MSFESELPETIKKLGYKIDHRRSEIREAYYSSGDDCQCDCSQCSDAHDDPIDDDTITEMEEELKVWERELQLLKARVAK